MHCEKRIEHSTFIQDNTDVVYLVSYNMQEREVEGPLTADCVTT